MTAEELELTARAFQESRVVLTAIELNVFTAVGDGATAGGVAGKLATDPRATEILLNALVAIGLLHKRDGVFGNEPLAEKMLSDDSPENARAGMLHMVHLWELWSTLTDRVRGITAPKEFRARGTSHHEALLASLNRRATERAPRLAAAIGTDGVRRLLDVGGGSAAYSIAFARESEAIAADVFDLPDVVPITERYIERAGLSGRIHTKAGDMLADDFGEGYDLVLLFSVTHMLGVDQNRDLIRRCYKALAPGGRLAIHDFVLEADKTAPRGGALFAINMLVATRNGSSYSEEEYSSWLREAGFASVERKSIEGPTSVVIGKRS